MAKNPEDNNTLATSEKLKALAAAMAKIEKDFGKGSIMKMGDQQVEDVDVIPTGSLALNAALGVATDDMFAIGSAFVANAKKTEKFVEMTASELKALSL